MTTFGEDFGLTEYSDEFINKIIGYRMHKNKEVNRYLSYEEIAEKENCTAEEIRKILTQTAIVWNH